MNELKEKIRSAFPGMMYRENVPYSELTTIGVGTTLPILLEPDTPEELSKLLKYLTSKGISYFIFGGGSNVIGMDMPYNGVGIRLTGAEFSKIEVRDDVFICGAKALLPELVKVASEHGFAGVSKLAGIPGTVGGAVRMNAGANGSTIGSNVTAIYGFKPDGTPFSIENANLRWEYRRGPVPAGTVVTKVVLKLFKSDIETEKQLIADTLAARREREPVGRTAGCAFRNVSEAEPAGKLIDLCGLKGMRCEGMQISERHANYIVNLTGEAMAGDYLKLLIYIRRAVSSRHNFFLKLEQVPVDPEFEKKLYSEVPAIKVNVLYGGKSSEREVSLRSGEAVANALKNGGFEVELTDITHCAILPSMKRCDVVYPVLHGGFGEDGSLQKIMEFEGLRFACSDSGACAAVMDKITTKRLLDKTKLPTAPWKIITRDNCLFPEELGLPLIVKVPCEGSTVGIVKVDSKEEWESAIEEEFKLSDVLLVESFIHGVEISIPVISGEAFEPIEIRSPKGFYDYDAKYIYKDGHTEYFCPPQSLDVQTVERAKKLAEAFYFISGCSDLVRVDFIVSPEGTPYILEGNTHPGCTATSLVPKSAKFAGLCFEKLVAHIVYSAMKRPIRRVQDTSTDKVLSNHLSNICIWMFRITLVLCALVLATSGLIALFTGLPGWPLVIAGMLMVLAELIFTWLKSMRKK